MIVLGIDVGYAGAPCGLAMVDDRAIVLLWHAEVKGRGKDTWARIDSVIVGLRDQLEAQAAKYTGIAYELPFYSKNAQTTIGLAHVGGAIRALALGLSKSVIGVTPSEAKLALTIDGGADKEAMIHAARLLFGVTLSSHEADACGIALAGAGELRANAMRVL